MLEILTNKTFARLFAAQVVALLGTGLLTIALGLLAYDLAGANAGQVLGLALTIKMIAYVGLSPLATAIVARMDRRRVLIGADLVRAGAALCLPFIDAVWQIYLLIFILQAASATFTPTFQAVIPDVLRDEGAYTRALSLSRLAYDLENLASPVLAGILLGILAPSNLFLGTCLGFILSALLVRSVALPALQDRKDRPFKERLTIGIRIYLATPRLRGLLALNFAIAFVGSIVFVLSIVIVRGLYDGSERDLAVAMGAFGVGSMVVALGLPSLLDRLKDREVMLVAALFIALLMAAFGVWIIAQDWPGWPVFLLLWCLIGAGMAAILTPAGRLLRRSAHDEDRPAIFAAQFALSHLCWLFAYPSAGFLGSTIGVPVTMILLGSLGVFSVVAARLIWPEQSQASVTHRHTNLPADHPHLADAQATKDGFVHRHPIVIDDEHRVWPTSG